MKVADKKPKSRSLDFGATSKAQQKMLDMADAAIELYVTVGFDQATFAKVAELCGTTRSHVQHYFDTSRDLFLLSAQTVRRRLQTSIESAIHDLIDQPEECLEAYVLANFNWAFKNPKDLKMWTLFFYHTGIDKECRRLNTELVLLGRTRIERFLRLGAKMKVFAEINFETAAVQIQSLITARILSIATEEIPVKNYKAIAAETAKACLAIACGRPI